MGLFAGPGPIQVNAFLTNPPTYGVGRIGVNRNFAGVIAVNSHSSYLVSPAGQATYGFEQVGSITITFMRMYGSAGQVTLSYSTSPGTATPGVDYTAVSGTLVWADGDIANKTVTITLLPTAYTIGTPNNAL